MFKVLHSTLKSIITLDNSKPFVLISISNIKYYILIFYKLVLYTVKIWIARLTTWYLNGSNCFNRNYFIVII